MNNRIIIDSNQNDIKAGHIKYMEDEKYKYWRVYFNMSRIQWALFENDYYAKDIKNFNKKDKDNQYKSLNSIPKYHVYKNSTKLGPVLTRETFEGKPFLFIPKSYKKGGTVSIKRDYYIYDVDEEYNINEKATLLFYQ